MAQAIGFLLYLWEAYMVFLDPGSGSGPSLVLAIVGIWRVNQQMGGSRKLGHSHNQSSAV